MDVGELEVVHANKRWDRQAFLARLYALVTAIGRCLIVSCGTNQYLQEQAGRAASGLPAITRSAGEFLSPTGASLQHRQGADRRTRMGQAMVPRTVHAAAYMQPSAFERMVGVPTPTSAECRESGFHIRKRVFKSSKHQMQNLVVCSPHHLVSHQVIHSQARCCK